MHFHFWLFGRNTFEKFWFVFSYRCDDFHSFIYKYTRKRRKTEWRQTGWGKLACSAGWSCRLCGFVSCALRYIWQVLYWYCRWGDFQVKIKKKRERERSTPTDRVLSKKTKKQKLHMTEKEPEEAFQTSVGITWEGKSEIWKLYVYLYCFALE